MGPNASNLIKSKRKVVVFYTKENSHEPIKALIKLLPFLRFHGLTTHCFDSHGDYTEQNFLETLRYWIQNLRNDLKTIPETIAVLDPSIVNLMLLCGITLIPNNPNLPQDELNQIKTDIETSINRHIELLNLVIKSVETIRHNGINFCTINLPTERTSPGQQKTDIFKTNEYIPDKILERLEQGETVSILVTSENFGIATELKEHGVTVREYYINYDPSYPQYSRPDYCLVEERRFMETAKEFLGLETYCGGYHLDGLVIRDPSMDPVVLIRQDLQEHMFGETPELYQDL